MTMVNQNNLPGVMQFESNLFSVGRVSPDSLAFRSKASASRADLKRFLINFLTKINKQFPSI